MSREFTVATLGLEDYEQRVLKSILRIYENRTPSFIPYVFKEGVTPHIVIVDADKPNALETWQAYRRAQGEKARISAVFLFKQAPAQRPKYHLRRPLITTRLLALFERIVMEEHGYPPALTIHPEDKRVAQELGLGQTMSFAAATRPPAAVQESVTALVVDDSLPVRIQMKTALQELVSSVDFAETGEQACEFIDRRHYDIIFLDVILPGIDGYEICKLIKKHPKNQRTPVIMLISNSSPADRIKGKLAGCDTYLIKPVRQAVFEEVVREFLKTPAAA